MNGHHPNYCQTTRPNGHTETRYVRHRHLSGSSNTMKKFAILPVGFLLPFMLISAVAGGAATQQAAVPALAAACVYGNPQPERVAVAMEVLTGQPVDQEHWDEWADTTGFAGTTYDQSTDTQRHELLVAAITHVLNTEQNATVVTPVMVWWHGSMPEGDTDDTWRDDPVPGWDGTLDTYVAEYANTYAVDPTVIAAAEADNPDYTCVPPVSSLCPQPFNITAVMATIRQLESGNNYTESTHSVASGYPAASGNPSGAYQYLASSWNNYGGYAEAFLAPSATQDQRASGDINQIIARFGVVEYVPIAWYVGIGGATRVLNGEWPLTYIPNPTYNRISIGDYQAKWMDAYLDQLIRAGGQPVPCPTGAEAVIEWADSQIGAKYAAVNPYRFGNPPWPGGSYCSINGSDTCWNYPKGTIVYDCSGFVIAAWRQAGVDFTALYGFGSSQEFNSSKLPNADRNALLPGDIAVYRPDAEGIGHIVLIHHIDPDGTVRTIEASGSYGVYIGKLNWARVSAIKRPAQPAV